MFMYVRIVAVSEWSTVKSRGQDVQSNPVFSERRKMEQIFKLQRLLNDLDIVVHFIWKRQTFHNIFFLIIVVGLSK